PLSDAGQSVSFLQKMGMPEAPPEQHQDFAEVQMKRFTRVSVSIVGATAVLGLLTGSALAHHSYAMFDHTRTVKITGTVKTLQWTNPHVYIWMVSQSPKGEMTTWGVESRSPNTLSHNGWNKRTFQPGDKVTIEMKPLKDGRPGGYFVHAVRA